MTTSKIKNVLVCVLALAAFAGPITSDTTLYAGDINANLAPVTKKDFRRCVEFTFPMDFLDEDETLENFPVLVRLSTAIPGFKYSEFLLPSGRDMMFTDSANHPIPSEIDTWDAEGTSLVWVSVPQLKKGTIVRMYYGNGANPAGVELAKWPGFAGVWHMGEASGTAYDSTTNGYDAVARQNARADLERDLVAVADGAVGAARVNQAGTTYYDIEETPNGSDNRRNYLSAQVGPLGGVGKRMTFSGWFRTTGNSEDGETLVCRRGTSYAHGWAIEKYHSNRNGQDVRLRVMVAGGGHVEEGYLTIPNDMRNNWVHLLVSFDESESKSVATIYSNGELVENGTIVGTKIIQDSGYPLTFGNNNSLTDGQAFYGQYDEMRLKVGSSSPNWAKAEYLTVTDPAFAAASGVRPANGGLVIMIH